MSINIKFPDDSIFEMATDPHRYTFTENGIEYGTGKYFSDRVDIKRTQLYCFLHSINILDPQIYLTTDGSWNVPTPACIEKQSPHFKIIKENIKIGLHTKTILSPAFSLVAIEALLKKCFHGPYDKYEKDKLDFDKNYHPRDYELLRKDWHYYWSNHGSTPYHQYINSRRWKRKADRLKEKYNNTCVICNACATPIDLIVPIVSIVVHHLTYEHLYDEYETDLLVVCDECHRYLHERYDHTEFDPIVLLRSNKKLLMHRENILNNKTDCYSSSSPS